jgi:N-methylhydantoinase B/oxoprolinase/acetone carboxylase alpha subunit
VSATLDPITAQLAWNRLLAIVEEQAQSIMQTAFCTIVRESGDLSAGLFDLEGRMIAQAATGTPGFIHTLAGVVSHIVSRHPIGAMRPGDAFITNDPWLNCGHLHDVTVARPVFAGERPIAFAAAAAHVVDIGGRGLGPDARSIHEEGLLLPPVPLARGGVIDEDVLALIRANVREPGQVVGDIVSLAASTERAAARLLESLAELGLDAVAPIAAHIVARSRAALEAAIARLPHGTRRYAMRIDGYDRPLDLVAAMTVGEGGMEVDFAGSSAASGFGINVVLAYAQAYAWFAIKCALAPEVPTNAGSLAPIRITAPLGSVLNAERPAPVSARHIVGHMLPDVMFGCLDQFLSGGCQAESGAALWGPQFRGSAGGFETITVHSGGAGGRPGQDGLSATAFPTNLRTVPVEIIEAGSPLVVWRRELRPDSGGAGEFRGGFGQTVEIGHRRGDAFIVSAMFDRVENAARGRKGGHDGAPGRVALASGAALMPKGVQAVPAGDRVRLDLPGGGGLGDPRLRERAKVAADLRAGLVSPRAARELYAFDTEGGSP